MYRKYIGPFRESGQAVWVSYCPLFGWGVRPYAAPFLGSAGLVGEKYCFSLRGAGVDGATGGVYHRRRRVPTPFC